ncbi:MAG TPA: hypothetical protein VL400_23985 [Polyangiaceae bacterium]|nr:hypothetical protein [Polyangiaceae bacterium]
MDPIVDLAPGTEDSPLVPYFAERIRSAVQIPKLARTFFALKAAIFAVDFDSGSAVTLRFDHGRLTIHAGTIGTPAVTFGGPLRALLSLHRLRPSDLAKALVSRRQANVVFSREDRASAPPPSNRGRVDAAELFYLYAKKELRVYGLVAHPRTVYRFVTLLGAGEEGSPLR